MPKVAYVGNFTPPHSTENDVRKAFEHLGWDVVRIQESEFTRAFEAGAFEPVYEQCLDADLVLHTMTQGSYPDPDRVLDLWRACERAGVPTASIHLDLFYGLASPKDRGPQRCDLPREHPMFRVAHVFTADGAHDDEFRRDGVNHHWLPPGVNHEEAIDLGPIREAGGEFGLPEDLTRRIGEGQFLVGFAGSDGYHPEWPHRPQLVKWLREQYRDRFLHIGGSATPRVTGLALNRVLASVPVWVGDSCLTSPSNRYWSDRVSETWGRGGFLIHPRVDALDDHYGMPHPGNTWEAGDWSALQGQISYWLDAVSSVGFRDHARWHFVDWTRAQDTYVNRVQRMLDVIGIEWAETSTPTPKLAGPRRFVLHRAADETGVSGTGDVAEGVEFSDGCCVLRWRSEHRSTAMYASVDDLLAVHGHGGKTELRWLDEVTA